MTHKKPTLDILTSMRGITIIYIIFFHLSIYSFFIPEASFWGFTTKTFAFSRGYVGVEFFFLLSVFVFLYQHHNKNLLSVKGYFDFQRKRVFRMYPLHIFTMLLFVPINLFLQTVSPNISNISVSPLYLIGHLTLTHAWGWFDQIGFNLISWYLSAQFFLYLIMPFFAYIYKNSKTTMIIITILLLMILGYVAYTTPHPVFSYNSIAFINQNSLLRAVTNMFVAGCAFWIYDVMSQKNIRTNFIIIIGCSLFLIYLISNYINPLFIPDVMVIPIMATIMIGLVCAKESIHQFFKLKWLLFIGEFSFGIFLIHGIFLRLMLGFPQYANLGLIGNTIAVALVLLCSIIAAYMLETYFDRPIQSWLSKKHY